MHLHITAIIFLILENLSKVFSQGVPMTPCPKTFQYRYNGSDWFGILSVNNPDGGQPLNLRVTLSMRGKPVTNYFGEIQMLTRGQFFSKEPVFYKVIFPKSHFPPKLLQITVNNEIVCIGAADLNIFVTQIQLEHTRKFTFIPQELSIPILPSFSPFLPATGAIGMGGGLKTAEVKDILTPLQPTNTAFDAFTDDNEKNSPMQNLKESCGTIDRRIRFQVLKALNRTRTSSTGIDDQAGKDDSFLASNNDGVHLLAAEQKGEGKIKRPLIISDISDDSKSKQLSIARGAWPWLAAVYVNNSTSLVYQCSGTLVSPSVVISAAHCFQLFKQHYTANEVLVFLGRHNLINWSEEGSLAAPVDDIFIHPDYNKNLNSYDADIAVLILKNKVRFNTFIRPACLWSGSTEQEYIEGEEGVVVAWSPGSKYFATSNTLPKIRSAPIVSNNMCFQANPMYESLSSNRTFCAGAMLQATTTGSQNDNQMYYGPCTGDSGAGLIIFKNNRWLLRGSVSGFLPLQPNEATTSNSSCSINQLVIYTDVAKYLDWITAFII